MKKIIVLFFSFYIIGYSLVQLYKLCMTTAPDFTVYYQSTYDVSRHINPYTDKQLFTAFNYPLITTSFFLPLVLLPLPSAQCVFLLLSYLCVFGTILLSFKILKKETSLAVLLFASTLALFSFPTKFTLGMGQINLIALFFLLLFFWRYQNKEKDMLIWFIFACLCKPILLCLLLFFLFRKKWKGMVLAGGVFGLLGILYPYFFGLQNTTLYYLQHVLPGLLTYSGREVYYNQGLSGFVSRLTTNLAYRQLWSSILATGLLSVSGWTFRKKVSDTALFSLLLTILVLVDGLSWQHHFIFLLFPFLYVWYQLKPLKKPLLIGAWILAYLLVSFNIKSPQQFVSFPSTLLLSHVVYGSLLLWGLQVHLQWRNTHSR